MIINTKIDFKKYLKLMYTLTYKKGATIFITITGIAMVLSYILHLSGIVPSSDNPTYQLFCGFFALVFIPLSIYFSAKRIFKSSGRLQENMTYEFFDQKIKITGESFNSEYDLTKSYKIEELHNWFLIYQSKQTANFIPKYDLSSNQINDIRGFFRQIKGVQLKLK